MQEHAATFHQINFVFGKKSAIHVPSILISHAHFK